MAKNLAGILAAAISDYRRVFDRFPESHEWGLDTSSDSSAGSGLMKALTRGNGNGASDFLSMSVASEHHGHYFNGLYENDQGEFAVLDLWGKPYQVIMDTNKDGVLSDPSAPDRKLKEKVIVWSGGPDGDPNTWDDNAATWLEVK